MGSLYTGDDEFPSITLNDFKPGRVVTDLSAFRIGETIVFKDKKGNHYEARAMSRGRRAWVLNQGWQLKFLECLIYLGSISREAYERVALKINSRHIASDIKYHEDNIKDSQKKLKELKGT